MQPRGSKKRGGTVDDDVSIDVVQNALLAAPDNQEATKKDVGREVRRRSRNNNSNGNGKRQGSESSRVTRSQNSDVIKRQSEAASSDKGPQNTAKVSSTSEAYAKDTTFSVLQESEDLSSDKRKPRQLANYLQDQAGREVLGKTHENETNSENGTENNRITRRQKRTRMPTGRAAKIATLTNSRASTSDGTRFGQDYAQTSPAASNSAIASQAAQSGSSKLSKPNNKHGAKLGKDEDVHATELARALAAVPDEAPSQLTPFGGAGNILQQSSSEQQQRVSSSAGALGQRLDVRKQGLLGAATSQDFINHAYGSKIPGYSSITQQGGVLPLGTRDGDSTNIPPSWQPLYHPSRAGPLWLQQQHQQQHQQQLPSDHHTGADYMYAMPQFGGGDTQHSHARFPSPHAPSFVYPNTQISSSSSSPGADVQFRPAMYLPQVSHEGNANRAGQSTPSSYGNDRVLTRDASMPQHADPSYLVHAKPKDASIEAILRKEYQVKVARQNEISSSAQAGSNKNSGVEQYVGKRKRRRKAGLAPGMGAKAIAFPPNVPFAIGLNGPFFEFVSPGGEDLDCLKLQKLKDATALLQDSNQHVLEPLTLYTKKQLFDLMASIAEVWKNSGKAAWKKRINKIRENARYRKAPRTGLDAKEKAEIAELEAKIQKREEWEKNEMMAIKRVNPGQKI
mmetsp:Transcript_10163/g.18665  ORF Transcript_10163/g.18665 Transcript_10163/m.18665 type:complete len:679 (+) Transcript_10163:338-2374(+)